MRNPGILVRTKEEPIKEGIVYQKVQKPEFAKLGKVLVTWKDGRATLKDVDKLEQYGFVD